MCGPIRGRITGKRCIVQLYCGSNQQHYCPPYWASTGKVLSDKGFYSLHYLNSRDTIMQVKNSKDTILSIKKPGVLFFQSIIPEQLLDNSTLYDMPVIIYTCLRSYENPY